MKQREMQGNYRGTTEEIQGKYRRNAVVAKVNSGEQDEEIRSRIRNWSRHMNKRMKSSVRRRAMKRGKC